MKLKRRNRLLLGVDSSFFPRSREAQERLKREANKPVEERAREIWEFIDTPASGTPVTERPELMRPGFHPRASRQTDPRQWFDVQAMWAFVDQARRGRGYTGYPFLVDLLTLSTPLPEQALSAIAQFFGIPSNFFQGLSAEQGLTQVVWPMFEEFEAMMNREKPPHIPGYLRFDISPENELAVVYFDR